MKKTICIFLAIFMMVGLCGCFGGDETNNVRGDIVSGNGANEPEFSLGKSANNTYNNAFLGLSCTLPGEWVFYTDEQILELNNIVGDVIDEDTAELLENASIIYDMNASYDAEGCSTNVNLEKLNAVQLISLDIRQTLEAQIEAIQSAYENMGYTDTHVEYQKVTVDGKEFDGLRLTANAQGVAFYVTIFTFRKGSYLANVSVSSFGTDKTDTILRYYTVQ